MEVLTENLRHPDKRVRLASSECLGKIGALDPSYLPNNVIKEGILLAYLFDKFHLFYKNSPYVTINNNLCVKLQYL